MSSVNPISTILTSTDPPVSWLLPGLLPRGYLVTLIADAGTGKSTLSYILGLALSTQTAFLGRTPTAPFTVLYFDQENSRPDRDEYLRWGWHGLGRPSLPMLEKHFWAEFQQLGHPKWAESALERIKAVQPALIVFDTAITCCPPQTAKGEDDNADAARTITKIRYLMSAAGPYPATAIVLKHARTFVQGQEPDLRGAKAWRSMADSVLFLMKRKGPPRADGLNNTRLFALKSRAFGLRQELAINPEWTEGGKGLRLDLGVEKTSD